MSFCQFLKIIKNRFYQLIIEMISFKFLIFILVVWLAKGFSQNIPYVTEIISVVAGGGVLGYKALKDKINKEN